MQNRTTLKSKISALTIMMIFLLSSVASAGTIVGSPHDFRGYQWKRSGEICTPCHAPHSTKPPPAPLWELGVSTETFLMYSKTDDTAQNAHEYHRPNGMSKICLSCHDGVTAPDRFGGKADGATDLSGKDPAGTNPSSNHPVSFTYDSALAATDKELYDPATRSSGLTGSTGTIDADLLFSNKMECSSCHDVHNTKAVPGTKLLVKDIAGSALCLTCHIK